MAEEFPSNSLRPKAAPASKSEPKKVERVTIGEVSRRKRPLGKRFLDTFFGGDAQGVMGYVFLDVLVPAAKDMVADAVTTAIERTLFGEVRSGNRRGGARSGPFSGGYTSYNRYSSPSSGTRREEPREAPREVSRRARASHDFDEIILATRAEAQEVIDRLFDLISQYEQATVNDLYELVGVSGNFTDESYGWTDIRGAGITRIRGGYLLDLPRAESLK